MKTIKRYLFEQKYKEWPEWRKFIHAYIFSFEKLGITAIYKYPKSYFQIRKMMKLAKRQNEK